VQILRCLLNGDSNKMIANHLNITEATVKVHLKSLLRKINASNRTQAAIWALNNGIGGEMSSGAGAVAASIA
jgi:two-component system nitrate/nitrite response regulator NarL